MSLSRPLKSLKIRLFSTFQFLENCYQIRKKTLTVWNFQTIKVILYSKLHFMFSHDFFISLAETFALKLDKSLCPEINIMETSSSRALLTVRKLHSQMTFLLFWAMMLVAHGLPNMISGVNSIIFINMLAYPIPLPSILQQSEVLNLPELVTLPDRSKKEKALT